MTHSTSIVTLPPLHLPKPNALASSASLKNFNAGHKADTIAKGKIAGAQIVKPLKLPQAEVTTEPIATRPIQLPSLFQSTGASIVGNSTTTGKLEPSIPLTLKLEAPSLADQYEAITLTKARGAYGHIFSGILKTQAGLPVIIKVNKDPRSYEDFLRESAHYEILKKEQIPYVIELIDHFDVSLNIQQKQDRHHALVFPQAFPTLREVIKGHFFQLKAVRIFCLQILKMLSGLAKINKCHADLTPYNILISPISLNILVIDWDSMATVPAVTERVQTALPFRAPELLTRQKNYDGTVDMWSLGCIIFQMITGSTLFAAYHEKYTEKQKYNLYQEQIALIVSQIGMPSDEFILNGSICQHLFKKGEKGFQVSFEGKMLKRNWKAFLIEKLKKLGALQDEIEECVDFISQMLKWEKRITADLALHHPFLVSRTLAKK